MSYKIRKSPYSVTISGPRSELNSRVVSTMAHNPWVAVNSPSRGVMDSNHMGSIVSLLNPDLKDSIVAGIEYEFAKYIDDVKVNQDCVVKGMVHKYPDFGERNPETALIVEFEYEDENGLRQIGLDLILLKNHASKHTYFGYRLHHTQAAKDIHYNKPLKRNTILCRTDCLDEEEMCWKYGKMANVVMGSFPGVGEDSILVRRGFLEGLKFTTHETFKNFINRDVFPVNAHGDMTKYKMFPDIGEMVGKDRLLYATRKRRRFTSLIDMSNQNICRPSYTFDNQCYAEKESVVVDVNVYRGNSNKIIYGEGMTEQLDYYHNARISYCENVVRLYEECLFELRKKFGKNFEPFRTPELITFLTHCGAMKESKNNKNKYCDARRIEIDQYLVEIVTMAVVTPDVGSKVTGTHGDKGVISGIFEDEDGYFDEIGNQADFVVDGNSSIFGRSIMGKPFEAHMGAFTRDNLMRIKQKYEAKYGVGYETMLTSQDISDIYDILHDIASISSTKQLEMIESLPDENAVRAYIKDVFRKGLRIYHPPDDGYNWDEVIRTIKSTPYRPHYGHITYTDDKGRRVKTKTKGYIGRMYMLSLNKVGKEFSAVNSAKINTYTLPVKGGEAEKTGYPHSRTPIGNIGESEGRNLVAYGPPTMIADMMDLQLNPTSHKQLFKHLLTSVEYDPNFSIDRSNNPYGGSKSLLLLKHVFRAAGIGMRMSGDDNE